MTAISRAAEELIVASEVVSKDVYERRYRRPEWPAGRSGVTVGIGYDLGYHTPAQIQADWSGLLPQPMIDAMKSVSGITGSAAKAATARVKHLIDIPWDKAVQVFRKDEAKWTRDVIRKVPGAEKLHPHQLGAIVSLSYNRGLGGWSSDADRFGEMRAIKRYIAANQLDKVPFQFRSMKRLWPGSHERGLPIRREKEAVLWERGLKNETANKIETQVNTNPPPLNPKPKGSVPETTAGGAVIAGGGGAAVAAGLTPLQIFFIVSACVLVAGFVFYLIRQYRRKTEVARQKDYSDDAVPDPA